MACLFLSSSFCRGSQGENVSLTWEDLKFNTCEVNVENSTIYVNREIIQKDTKTKRSRLAEVPSLVMKAAKELRDEHKKLAQELGDKWVGYRGAEFDKNFMFIQWNGKQMHPDSPYSQFKRIIRLYNENVATCQEEETPSSVTPHAYVTQLQQF